MLRSQYFYICMLILSIAGLTLADFRYKLVFWYDKLASGKAIVVTMLILLLFDIAGVLNHIFSTNQEYVIGIYVVTKDLPIEEFLFLFLLSYVTLLIYQSIKRIGGINHV